MIFASLDTLGLFRLFSVFPVPAKATATPVKTIADADKAPAKPVKTIPAPVKIIK